MDSSNPFSAEVWAKINGTGDPKNPGLLKATMGPMRVAQKIFPWVVRGNDNSFPADTIDPESGIPTTGQTKSVATIKKAFQLFPVHVQDPDLTVVMNQVLLAAQSLALVEDMLYFQGTSAKVPEGVAPTGDIGKLGEGLLGVASRTIEVPLSDDGKTYGVETYNAVAKGISSFTADLQGPPYALILDPAIFADASFQISFQDIPIIRPASAIQALLEGGFVMSPGMPSNTGLLVSLGGNTTTLYVGTDPVVEFNAYGGSTYSFTARESIQFHNIDKRSLIKLSFLGSANAAGKGAARSK